MMRVMIVATYDAVRDGLCTVLRLAGSIEIKAIASSAGSAIRQAALVCLDAALVDLEMPEDEGYETIQQLHRLYPGVTIIALTAHDYPTARAGAIQAGADEVMVKGLGVREMVEVLQNALRGNPRRHHC